ncbi:tumor necrosis factor receptor superfamily member 14 isoform X2 [Ambystoma mexicanum]|uniref:tumor necrosis factor receptor superfamily member 14 isoform X2 n=1 Tax=Ambystoma mexicanum TaxID=8296 RepID=UPI0037E8D5E4
MSICLIDDYMLRFEKIIEIFRTKSASQIVEVRPPNKLSKQGRDSWLNNAPLLLHHSTGSRVQEHCTQYRSTSCIPCVPPTYMDHPNGLQECFRCTVCDPSGGLKEAIKCTYTKNTVCSCKDGYYCTERNQDGCDFCEKHTSCGPGDRVKVHGTEISNTVCENCPHGSFSRDNMSEFCTTWTSCPELGKKELFMGNSTSDAVCSEPDSSVGVIAGIIVTILVLLAVAIIYIFRKKIRGCPRKKRGTKKTNDGTICMATEASEMALTLPIQETLEEGTADFGSPDCIM